MHKQTTSSLHINNVSHFDLLETNRMTRNRPSCTKTNPAIVTSQHEQGSSTRNINTLAFHLNYLGPPLFQDYPASGTCSALGENRCLSELREEFPRVAGRERRALSRVDLRRVVVAVVDDPGHGEAGLASSVPGLDRVTAVGLGLVGEPLAAVEADVLVAELTTHGNVQDRVRGAVLAVESNGGVASVAAAQLSAGDDSDGADLVRAGTGKSVGHAATVAETGREAEVGVDAKVVLNCLNELVKEGDILAVGVGPALVQTIRNDKDGSVLGNGLEAVERKNTSSIGVLAVDNLLGAGASLVPLIDNPVRVVLVVVVRHVDEVVAGLAVDGHRILLVGDGLGFAAAGRVCRKDCGN
ncbi:hypothetical protein B5807_08500 [Epicoccum nigrum]|uniref:Uncharacterized protein n=1 Tax=Epicoccum nigrum TaxID=105696 RepID=A0A1Y2LRU2_EPING|nr:hypothetical protein B5807_08500 [Epicoccum nigrum]